jgi:hypothetical protein
MSGILGVLLGDNAAAAGGGSPAYVYRGDSGDLGASSPATFSGVSLGTASADRFVVVCLIGFAAGATYGTTLTVDGSVTLNRDVFYNAAGSLRAEAFYSGVVSSGSGTHTIAATTSGESDFVMHVWTMTGASFAFRHSASSTDTAHPTTISVTAGDFMFGGFTAANADHAWNTGSTQASFADHPDSTFGGFIGSDWTISATNASFNIVPNSNSNGFTAATYS